MGMITKSEGLAAVYEIMRGKHADKAKTLRFSEWINHFERDLVQQGRDKQPYVYESVEAFMSKIDNFVSTNLRIVLKDDQAIKLAKNVWAEVEPLIRAGLEAEFESEAVADSELEGKAVLALSLFEKWSGSEECLPVLNDKVLNRTHILILLHLYVSPAAQATKSLATLLEIAPETCSRNITKLRGWGFIDHPHLDTPGRRRELSLSAKGVGFLSDLLR